MDDQKLGWREWYILLPRRKENRKEKSIPRKPLPSYESTFLVWNLFGLCWTENTLWMALLFQQRQKVFVSMEGHRDLILAFFSQVKMTAMITNSKSEFSLLQTSPSLSLHNCPLRLLPLFTEWSSLHFQLNVFSNNTNWTKVKSRRENQEPNVPLYKYHCEYTIVKVPLLLTLFFV